MGLSLRPCLTTMHILVFHIPGNLVVVAEPMPLIRILPITVKLRHKPCVAEHPNAEGRPSNEQWLGDNLRITSSWCPFTREIVVCDLVSCESPAMLRKLTAAHCSLGSDVNPLLRTKGALRG
jgi:hypothetical protein